MFQEAQEPWDFSLWHTHPPLVRNTSAGPQPCTKTKNKGQTQGLTVQEDPTAPKINSNYGRISTLPGKLLKLEIRQETNGHDCRQVNR